MQLFKKTETSKKQSKEGLSESLGSACSEDTGCLFVSGLLPVKSNVSNGRAVDANIMALVSNSQ